MPDAKEVEFSLKVFINKEKSKVLFAEADNDFADVLLSFLWLPMGKIVKILEKHYGDNAPSIGSLTTLYNGLLNPDNVALWTEDGKDVLNNPKSATKLSKLKVSLDYSSPSKYKFGESYKGRFTQNSASFIISDDLRMFPNASGSIIQTLSKLGIDITDMNTSEVRNVTFRLKEVIDLLKGSLLSPTPLSDLLFSKTQTIISKAGITKHDKFENHDKFEKDGATCFSKKMILKVMFQKSTNKFLFAQADEDFVDFLFSLLIIPLGGVEWLLGSNTCLNNIDNLHRSIADNIDDKYLTLSKERAQNPNVDGFCARFKHFLPFSKPWCRMIPEDPHKAFFVGGSRMYMVTDDLIVTRLCVSSTISVLEQMKISLSDVEEVEFEVGLEEALNILKASLTSTCALTDGLINPKLKEQPKQKHALSLISLGSLMLLLTLVVILLAHSYS